MATSRVGPKGQVVLPKRLRDELRIVPGDRVVFSVQGGKVLLTPVGARSVSDLFGALRTPKSIDVHGARRDYADHLARKFKGDRTDG